MELNKVYNLDCLKFLKDIPSESIDSIVTDPPAGISFMGADWDSDKGGRDGWIRWMSNVFEECLRVLKPGAHGLVWALPRTSHWTAMALEDAGFEIRDIVNHIFSTGFPKSLNISKEIDSMYNIQQPVVGTYKLPNGSGWNLKQALDSDVVGSGGTFTSSGRRTLDVAEPVTDDAVRFSGWGTGLKPACEYWILIRKPLAEKTIVGNCLKWGTGGINIDACRIYTNDILNGGAYSGGKRVVDSVFIGLKNDKLNEFQQPIGRFPSNLILDNSEEIKNMCDLYGQTKSGKVVSDKNAYNSESIFFNGVTNENNQFGDSGNIMRFFYCPKAFVDDREEGLENFNLDRYSDRKKSDGVGGDNPRNRTNNLRKNIHPTVKHTSLMMYLCRLITPPGGLVIDPFAGSGSTGKACILEDFKFIGCDENEQFCQIANARLQYTIANKDKLKEKYSDSVNRILPTKNKENNFF